MGICHQGHDFQDIEELLTFRYSLLKWYDKNKRDLPWRTLVRHGVGGWDILNNSPIGRDRN
jgi:adenine-specific DNA glycosylase